MLSYLALLFTCSPTIFTLRIHKRKYTNRTNLLFHIILQNVRSLHNQTSRALRWLASPRLNLQPHSVRPSPTPCLFQMRTKLQSRGPHHWSRALVSLPSMLRIMPPIPIRRICTALGEHG